MVQYAKLTLHLFFNVNFYRVQKIKETDLTKKAIQLPIQMVEIFNYCDSKGLMQVAYWFNSTYHR